MRLNLNCREVAGLLSRALDESLPQPQVSRVQWHLLSCRHCRDVKMQLAFLRRAVRESDRRLLVPQDDGPR